MVPWLLRGAFTSVFTVWVWRRIYTAWAGKWLWKA